MNFARLCNHSSRCLQSDESLKRVVRRTPNTLLRKLAFYALRGRKRTAAKRFLRAITAGRLRGAYEKLAQASSSKMRYIDNLDDLDLELQRVDGAFAISDDEGRRALAQFHYVARVDLPRDPYSPEYLAAQLRLYSAISGRDDYSAQRNERTKFDFEKTKDSPFPYSTQSPVTVGDQLIAQGFILRMMDLPPKAHILEFGAGWGNTTLLLVQMGYDVTVVEIDQAFLDLIAYRLGQIGKHARLIHHDMLEFASTEKYDAVLFFESFHHCADHLRLLRNLQQMLSDDGMIVFAAEPIAEFSHPWGIRLDGISVWSIRKFGWLELGFDTSYFLRTLLLLGWLPVRERSSLGQWTDVILAKKSKLVYFPSNLTLPPDEDVTWAPKETLPGYNFRFTKKHALMSCTKEIRPGQIEFCLSNYAPFELKVILGTGSISQEFVLPRQAQEKFYRVPVQEWQGRVAISSSTWNPAIVFRNKDPRELGVAVHSIRIIPQVASG